MPHVYQAVVAYPQETIISIFSFELFKCTDEIVYSVVFSMIYLNKRAIAFEIQDTVKRNIPNFGFCYKYYNFSGLFAVAHMQNYLSVSWKFGLLQSYYLVNFIQLLFKYTEYFWNLEKEYASFHKSIKCSFNLDRMIHYVINGKKSITKQTK